ncbi:hypothetical protein [Methylorubrum extorquens]|uniref:hypothetical protein n=1 Tax=Methylorubrum extorquens TaxID=408 RepID=UPI001EE52365|nr:hypothetical protein [Methylorubrum extorquens]MCG5246914.1 hypothetical protein [Methylorubrum extorquens]
MLASPVNPTATPRLPVSTPPFSFGAPFAETVHRNERKGDHAVFFADMTPAAELAQRHYGRELSAAGFHLPGYVRVPGVDGLALRAVRWPERCRLSAEELADLTQRVADLPRVIEEARARRAAEVAASDAAYSQRGWDGLPRLAGIVADAPWQLGRLIGEASEILKSELTDSSACRVVELLQTADRTAENAEARLRRGAPRDWQALAEDAGVRDAALIGCRLLSTLDGDRASKRNGIGWGADDSAIGHTLAGRETLTPTEAAHALALLHHHRRQLPGPLLSRLFHPAAAGLQPALL